MAQQARGPASVRDKGEALVSAGGRQAGHGFSEQISLSADHVPGAVPDTGVRETWAFC